VCRLCQQRVLRRRGLFGRLRHVFDINQHFKARLAVHIKSGARRNDVAHDDVFLEAAQRIHARPRGRLGEHTSRVLERRGTEEAVGFERRLGDAQQHRRGFGGFAAHLLDALIFLLEVQLVYLFAPKELRVTRLGNAHFAEHLAHNDFDVLVVDGDALEAIDLLYFADEVLLQFLRAANVEDFVRVNWAFGQLLAFFDEIALEDDDVLANGDEVFLLRLRLRVLDENAAFAAHARAKVHHTVNLGNFRGVLRPARLEQLGHARQTAGDVLGLGLFAGRLGQQRAGHDFIAFTHDNVRSGRNGIIGHDLAGVVADGDLRVQILLVLDDNHGFLAGGFVRLLLHRHAFDDVVELHLAGLFGKNRHVVRVPLHEGLALFDFGAVLERNDRADDDVVIFQFTAVVVEDGHRAVFVQHDVVAILQFNVAQFVVMNGAVVLGFDLRNLEHLRRRAADVERPHRELRARL